MKWKSEYMPMLVPHPCAGSLKAAGAVTGTQYTIKREGTWVWAEDLPGLLQEKRSGLCPRTDEPVRAFALAVASLGNAVPYRPWPGGEEPQEEASVIASFVEPTADLFEGWSAEIEEVEEPEEEAVIEITEEAPGSQAEAEDQPKARRRKKREL